MVQVLKCKSESSAYESIITLIYADDINNLTFGCTNCAISIIFYKSETKL